MIDERTVIIIDDGVQEEYLPGKSKVIHFYLNEKLQICAGKCTKKAGYNHATLCAAVIEKYADHVQFYSIKVMSDLTHTCTADALLNALRFCKEQNWNRILMSIGTTVREKMEDLRKEIYFMVELGFVIVAAASNSGNYTVPASLPGVFGVRADASLRDEEIKRDEDMMYTSAFRANGNHLLSLSGENGELKVNSNSFAAPVVTAKILKLLKENPRMDRNALWKKLWGKTDCPCFFYREKAFVLGQKVPYWTEKGYLKELERLKNKKYDLALVSGIPVISFIGDEENLLFVLKMAQYLEEAEYETELISDIREGQQQGFWYYQTEEEFKTLTKMIMKRYSLSCLIALNGRCKISADFVFEFSLDSSIVKKEGNQYKIPMCFNEKIAKDILRILTE